MDILLFGGRPEQLEPKRKEALDAAAAPLDVVITNDPEKMESHIREIVVAVRQVPLDILSHAPRLEWYQHWYAGVDHLVDSLGERDMVITNASGVHAEPMAEQVFACILSLVRAVHLAIRSQTQRRWPRQSEHSVGEILGKSLLVVGMGAVGTRVAEIGAAFGMDVRGVTRTGQHSSFPVVQSTKVHDELGKADVVVVTLPLTPRTRGLLDAAAISRLKPGSIFVNVGRGALVDQDALIQALREGRIGGAALDVTDPEPLPHDSPLWDLENVIITPHMSGVTDRYEDRIWDILLDNLARYHRGEPLRNVVDPDAGY